MDIGVSLEKFNKKLSEKGESRELIIAGGAALILLGEISRATVDVDVISPRLDDLMNQIVKEVSLELGLDERWLNNGASLFIQNLPDGWKDHIIEIKKYSHLMVYSLSKRDLVTLKLDACLSRAGRDLNDLKSMNLSIEELENSASPLRNIPHLINDQRYQRNIDKLLTLITNSEKN